jgi:transketolase
MNKAFDNCMYEIMQNNRKVVYLHGDQKGERDDEFRLAFPDRYYNMGIAENNMIGVAAALAKDGFIPVVFAQGAFLAYRAMEFIRVDVCLQKTNVKIIAMGAGVKVNNLGPTHHLTEDIAVMRVLPNLTIVSPASPFEVVTALERSIEFQGPVYFRLGKAFENEIYQELPKFEIGKSTRIREGDDLTIIATGSILASAIEVAKRLRSIGVNSDVINMSTIKPIDRDAILLSTAKTHRVVTIEEHQRIGGLGGAVAEVLATSDINAKLEIIGFNDAFCTTYGWHRDILKTYGLSEENIFTLVKKMLEA